MPGKLGRTSKERNALLRGLASQLLWYGKIETTAPKAKELQSYVEKLITKAVNTFDDNVEFEVVKKDKNGKKKSGGMSVAGFKPNKTMLEMAKGFSLRRALSMLGGKFTKEEILGINRKLNKIKKKHKKS